MSETAKKTKLFDTTSQAYTSMDKPIENNNKKKKKIIYYSSSVLVLVLIISLLYNQKGSHLKVEYDKITIEQVKKDIFQDYISLLGTVEPFQTIYLDATEGGRVEEIYIREGTAVKKGDKIMRLSNDNLLLEISNYETEVARAINDLKTMRVNLENQQINDRSQMVEYYYDLLKLERIYKNNVSLIKEKYISQEEFQLSRENFERKKKLYELLSKKVYQDSLSISSRIHSSEESVASMQKNLEIIRGRLNKLIIQAPADGELATLFPELGKVIAYGTPIGTINILDFYKIKAEIDEHYIARVKLKLKAVCDFGENDFSVNISKIYPEVKDGKFSVDMVFTGSTPPDIRIGQTSRIKLELGKSQTAILLPRGGFYQTTGGQWVFVLDKNENYAVKKNITIGQQNPDFYEVLDGLKEGDRVIVSGYEDFGDSERLLLK